MPRSSFSVSIVATWKRAHRSYLAICLAAYAITAVSLFMDWQDGVRLTDRTPPSVAIGLVGIVLFGFALYRAYSLEKAERRETDG